MNDDSHSAKSEIKSTRTGAELENLLLNYILIFMTCAFAGWIWEVIIAFIQHGAFVNRGILHGPWLPIYGFGALGIIILLNRFKDKPWLVFLTSSLLCGIIEYGTAWYLETFKHMKWWDYSNSLINLDGRICAESIICFGLAGLLAIYVVYPKLTKLFNHIKPRPKKVICFILLLIFIGDFIYSSDYPNTGRGITSDVSQAMITETDSHLILEF